MADRFDAAKHVETGARVQVTLDIKIAGAWGADCTLGQVYVQAKDEVEGMIRRLFADEKVVLVGEPRVVAITNAGRAQ